MDPMYEAALQIIREAKTELHLAGNGRQIFNELKKTLIQHRRQLIHPSTTTSTLQNLLQNRPQLLKSFKPFFPIKFTAAAAAESSAVSDCVDFMNRILTRFGNGEVCRRFAKCMIAYSRDEISNDELRDAVVGILGDNDDLVAEFMCFFTGGERSRKRSLVDDLVELPPPKRSRKSPESNSGNEEISAAVPPPWRMRKSGKAENKTVAKQKSSGNRYDETEDTRKSPESNSGRDSADKEISTAVSPPWRMRNSGKPENKNNNKTVAKQKSCKYDETEDMLLHIDVQIGNLESVQVNAERLAGDLHREWISPAEVRLERWLTPFNLAFIRKMDRRILGAMEKDLGHGLKKLMEMLLRKKTFFDKERVKIVEKLIKIRCV